MADATETDRPGGAASRGPRDMIISLVVLLVPVLLLVAGYQILTGRNQPTAVDPAPAVAQARAAGLAAVVPADLGEDWVVVSAVVRSRADGTILRLGYAAPGGESAQVVQSDVPPETLLAQELAEAGPPTGTVQVAGQDWQVFASRPGERALVAMAPEQTTLVVGTAADHHLQALAAALP